MLFFVFLFLCVCGFLCVPGYAFLVRGASLFLCVVVSMVRPDGSVFFHVCELCLLRMVGWVGSVVGVGLFFSFRCSFGFLS